MPNENTSAADTTSANQVKPKLLIVDDQSINIQTLYQIFANDHQIFMATSGKQALALCESKSPDLVLLDIEMPEMNGFEVCTYLKANPNTRDIPVIFVTGHSDEAAETRGLDVGAVDFISKPFNPRIVRARVKTHLMLKAHSDLLRNRVYLDGLTGVHNRRYFDERASAEWGRTCRNKNALSVLMIDVDQFKNFNDHYGHLAGDDCLRQIATALKGGLNRSTDLVARFGGEEFVCLLTETELAGALEVAERLRQQVFALNIPHAFSTAASVVTVSIGVANRPAGAEDSDDTIEALLQLADEQLYMAKEGGRNQVFGTSMPMATPTQ